jgi:eukaryotic-like serine/threonine-protein kinase
MSLTPGSQLGSYEIQGLLGEGGMGQVYKARDGKLGREVAIKVLPPSVANDPERLARFEREAKLLASLSHTNIAQIYGLEEAAPGKGGRFLVMELAPGQDLSTILEARRHSAPAAVAPTESASRGATASEGGASRAIDIEDALPLAVQITYALEAAHDRGIVHRDLKPANIKVSDDGAVKVLDFGLAKAFASGDAESASAMNSPTLTAQATAAGVILGTAAYMSPEQARGREADKRADVWAFGVVFFEMLTGARLFQGETISDTLAAVLRQDIPWSTLPPGTPGEITRLLRRCLERDRKNRLHDIADARIVLEEVVRGGGKEEPIVVTSPPGPAGMSRSLIFGAGAIAALALGVVLGRWTAPAPATAPIGNTVRLVVPAPKGVTAVGEPAVAPDGSFLVFVGRSGTKSQQLYIQHLDQTAPRAIDRTEGAAQPFLSFDGRWIAFRRNNRLERIAIDGSEPLPITAIPRTGPGGVWLPDNTILFAKSWLSELWSVTKDGGDPRKVSTLDKSRGEIGHWFPSALPDPRRVLITTWMKGAGVNDAEIAVLNLDTGKHEVLFKGAEGRYVAPGFIVFFRAGAFHAVRFNATTFKASGEPVQVLDDAYGNTPEGDISETEINAAGTLAYLSGPNTHVRQLTWISSGGKSEPLPFPARAYTGASITEDGTRAAVGLVDSGRHLLRLLDLVHSSEDVLDLPGMNWGPAWHPDGKRLAFRSLRKGDFDAYWKDLTTNAPPEPLLVTDFDESPAVFLPDGTGVVVQQSNADGLYRETLLALPPKQPPAVLVSFTSSDAAISRDGKLMAFLSDRSDTREVYVQPISGGAVPIRVSTGGARNVAWSRDGKDLLYLRPPEIIAVSYRIEAGTFKATGERVWAQVEGNYADGMFSVGADGRMLVALKKDQPPREIRVVTNWQQEILKKLK